jgi:hypothetical protein
MTWKNWDGVRRPPMRVSWDRAIGELEHPIEPACLHAAALARLRRRWIEAGLILAARKPGLCPRHGTPLEHVSTKPGDRRRICWACFDEAAFDQAREKLGVKA